MLVRFWSQLVAAAHEHPDIAIARFAFSWDLSPKEMIDVRSDMRPDAVVVLDDGRRKVTFFVEIDTGSESAAYFGQHKIDLFVRSGIVGLAIAGFEPDAMLVVAPRSTRLLSIARAYPGPKPGILGLEFDRRSPVTLLGSTWVRLDHVVQAPHARCSIMDSPEALLSRPRRR